MAETMRRRNLWFIFAAGILASSCKTTQQDSSSDVQGAMAANALGELVSADTPEEVVKAVTKRLNDVNRYTNTGEIASAANCPVSESDPCSLVNIFIEFETAGTPTVGHTAISISRGVAGEDVNNRNDMFFDFGPGTDIIDGKKVKVGDPGIFSLPPGPVNGLFSGVPGTQWWDNPHRFSNFTTASEIGVREIMENLDRLADDYTVMRVPICVNRSHAALMTRYWVKTYMNMPTYRIPGNHCTSMVAQSFESTLYASQKLNQSTLGWAAETLDAYVPNPREIKRWITSPTGYAERVLSGKYSGTLDYRHQCGVLKGKAPKAVVVRTENMFLDPKMKDHVKWTTDRSMP